MTPPQQQTPHFERVLSLSSTSPPRLTRPPPRTRRQCNPVLPQTEALQKIRLRDSRAVQGSDPRGSFFHGRAVSFSFPASDHHPFSCTHSPGPQRTPHTRLPQLPPSSLKKVPPHRVSRRYAQRAQHAKVKTHEALFTKDTNKSRTAYKASTANAAREIQKEHGFVPDAGLSEWTNARELLLQMTEREYNNHNKIHTFHDLRDPSVHPNSSVKPPPQLNISPNPNSSPPSPALTRTHDCHPSDRTLDHY